MLSLCDGRSPIVAREAVAVNGDLKEGPFIGSGPWVVEENTPNKIVRLARNPDYFFKDRPYVDKFHILRLADASLDQEAFRTRQLYDWDSNLASEVKQMQRAIPSVQDRVTRTGGGPSIWLPFDKAPTTDIRVRQGINKLFDRQQLIDGVVEGFGWWTVGLSVPQADWLLPEDEAKRLLAHDPAAARALFQQAGFSGWNPTFQVYSVGTNPTVGELVQQHLVPGNIRATIQIVDAAVISTAIYQRGEFQMALVPQALQATTNSDLYVRFYGGAATNGTRTNDPRLNQLIDQQAVELDPAKRKPLVLEVQRRMIEVATMNRLFGSENHQLTWPFVKNLGGSPVVGENSQWEYVWLDL
jgi:peptide/nickel transport system substrate-binding protein